MTTLKYRSRVMVDDLGIGECTIHRASTDKAARWWLLWFYAARETDGVPEFFCVPVNPNGDFTETGPGGRTWGLKKTVAGNWQVSPSINVLDSRDAVPGALASRPSLWHQTPIITDVTRSEPWESELA